MSKGRLPSLIALPLGLLLASLACNLQSQLMQPTATQSVPELVSPVPSPLVTPTLHGQLQNPTVSTMPPPDGASTAGAVATAFPAGTDVPPQEWQMLRPGLERRLINLPSSEGGVRETLYVLRIDPLLYEFDVGYKPGAPQRLMDWQREMDALIVVNGGYFTPEYQATGLIITNGQAVGTSYAGYGGMLAITAGGPEIRSLTQQPYNPYEPLHAAVQSFPVLVKPGGQTGYPQEDGLADRRTVIAQDRQGRILFILAQTGTMTLHELSRYLVDSDLDLAIALNLDGGASTGIQLAEPSDGVAPFSLLPIVIAVRPRG